jgi:hypothetical protein
MSVKRWKPWLTGFLTTMENGQERSRRSRPSWPTIRGPALYGYEPEGVPASEAFTKDYATETLEGTRTIANLLIGFASRDAAT